MSFYRTYRPQVIDEIDNSRVQEVLLSLLHKERKDLPHAYLFTGPRGTGKTTAARVLSKMFLCQKNLKNGPCGVCDSCRQIADGRHIDVIEIDAASNRGIDEIRSLRDSIALSPVMGDYKIYIIDEVHMLTTEAFNALLKTLEEPPRHAIFVLATTDPQKLPKTIISRCLHLSFTRATDKELYHAVKRIIDREKIKIDDAAIYEICRAADGSFRDAVKFLEQVSFNTKDITKEIVRENLALTSEKYVNDLLNALASRDPKTSIAVIENILSSGGDIKQFVVEVLRNLEARLLVYVNGSYTDALSVPDIKNLIHRLSQVYSELKSATIPQLPLELAVVEFCDEKKSSVVQASVTTPTFESKESYVKTAKEETKMPKILTPSAEHKSTDEAKKKKDDIVHETSQTQVSGMLTTEHLIECWTDVIAECKPLNHSIAGVLRSARPKEVSHGIVTLEAFYKFHQEKLSEVKSKEMLTSVFKKLFGEIVKIEIVLGKK